MPLEGRSNEMPTSKRRGERQAEVVSLPWHEEVIWKALGRKSVKPGDLPGVLVPSSLVQGCSEGQQADPREDVGWTAYLWQPPRKSEEPRPRGAGVATFARRLMAMERSRIRRATPPAYAHRGDKSR